MSRFTALMAGARSALQAQFGSDQSYAPPGSDTFAAARIVAGPIREEIDQQDGGRVRTLTRSVQVSVVAGEGGVSSPQRDGRFSIDDGAGAQIWTVNSVDSTSGGLARVTVVRELQLDGVMRTNRPRRT